MTARIFRPVRLSRASDDVVEQVRAAVFRGDLHPGDRLPSERKLAVQFGVSRVTVRDALRALEAGGLIRVKVGGGGGPYVATPDVELLSAAVGNHLKLIGTEFRELAEARLALETTAARLACERATPEDLEALRLAIGGPAAQADNEAKGAGGRAGRPVDAAAEASTRPQGRPERGWGAAGVEEGAPGGRPGAPRHTRGRGAHDSAVSSVDFHTALVAAAHNRALLAMFNATRALMEDAMDLIHTHLPDTAAVARRVHTRLYEAVAARDADLAVRIMRDHLYDFIDRVRRVQEARGDAADGLFL